MKNASATRDGHIATRRDAIKSVGFAAASVLLPTELALSSNTRINNPRWFGFNLLEYFSTDSDWMKHSLTARTAYSGRMISAGYAIGASAGCVYPWTTVSGPIREDCFRIHEPKTLPIDRNRLGEQYGIHVNLCMQRAPGYCILDGLGEALTGIHITKEKGDLFHDPKMLDAFVYQWTYFARRYKGISSGKLKLQSGERTHESARETCIRHGLQPRCPDYQGRNSEGGPASPLHNRGI